MAASPGRKQSTSRMGRPRDEAVDRAIMAAATDVLRQSGYGAFSMEGVAARAGVAKQSIYRRWPSKGALLLDIYVQGMDEDGAVGVPARGLMADFQAYLSQSVQRLQDVAWANMLRSIVAEAQTDAALRATMIERVVEPRREVGRHILRAAIRSGELPPQTNIETALDFAFGAIWYRLLLGHAPLDRKFVRQVLEGLFRPNA
ncbi:transcriptional regulator, TetR family [Rhizobiales bacterium GAS113]|nr:transcriptional regulator, TetR family [Rhizobiales bacterium GAS113]